MTSIQSQVVNKLCSLLEQRPTTFEITILSAPVEGDSEGSKAAKKNILSLDESLIIVEGAHLGLDARSLPWMTQEIRQEYKRLRKEETENLLAVTSCLLLVNPDHSTAWADRRRSLLPRDNIETWQQELEYLNLLMTQHSKAPSSWGHRKYVIRQILKYLDDESTLIKEEIRVCREVAERYPKNYYAWTHRRYLWTIFSSTASLLQMEWEDIVDQWLPQHISDHSAAHYGSQVLMVWMNHIAKQDPLAVVSVATEAMAKVRTLVDRHEEHETLWILRRLVVRILLEHSRHDSRMIDIVMEDITQVQEKDATAGLVHFLTFQAWVYHISHDVGYQNELFPNKGGPVQILSTLRDHPRVYHELWKQTTPNQ